MMDEMAAACPDVVRVLDDVPPVRFPVWLVTHRELHTSRRIRLVFDRLAEALREPGTPIERGLGTAGRKPSGAARRLP